MRIRTIVWLPLFCALLIVDGAAAEGFSPCWLLNTNFKRSANGDDFNGHSVAKSPFDRCPEYSPLELDPVDIIIDCRTLSTPQNAEVPVGSIRLA